jgi:hypothetical protein
MVGRRASERLIAEKHALARSITDALYAERPDLLEKYGPVGREKCHQDMLYHVEHLAPAVDLGEPGMFAAYVRWLEALLRARNVAPEEVMRTLELIELLISDRFPADEAAVVVPCVRAGLAALRDPGAAA